MTAAFSMSAAYLPAAEPRLRPSWVRPAILGLVVACHGLAFFLARGAVRPIEPFSALEISLERMDAAPEETVSPESPPPEPETPAVKQELAAPPPVVAPDAPPLPKAEVKPAPKPVAVQKKHDAPVKAHKPTDMAKPSGAGSMSRGDFQALLIGELKRRMFYPEAARAAGVTGAVGVTFVVGPAGRVISQSITRSSGNAALDGAARVVMSAIRTPPPPGGRYSVSTNLTFHTR